MNFKKYIPESVRPLYREFVVLGYTPPGVIRDRLAATTLRIAIEPFIPIIQKGVDALANRSPVLNSVFTKIGLREPLPGRIE